MAGVGDFLGGIGKLLGWFSPENRLKSLREKIEQLRQERSALLIKTELTTEEKRRLIRIDDELSILRRKLEAKADAN